MNATLNEKVIIVTGANGGIGASTARVLANKGAKVVLTDLKNDSPNIADSINQNGGKAVFLAADLCNENEVEKLVADTINIYGKLDCAFNNAGVEQCATPLAELTSEQWTRAINIDLTAVFYCLKYQIKAMLKLGGGSIVNTASALGSVAIQGACEYVAAKHGVAGLTKAACADYASQGIRVNAILPGIIETPMISRLATDSTFSVMFEKLKERHPIGRFGTPEEVGNTVAWLFSDEASLMNGAMISVDGGYLSV